MWILGSWEHLKTVCYHTHGWPSKHAPLRFSCRKVRHSSQSYVGVFIWNGSSKRKGRLYLRSFWLGHRIGTDRSSETISLENSLVFHAGCRAGMASMKDGGLRPDETKRRILVDQWSLNNNLNWETTGRKTIVTQHILLCGCLLFFSLLIAAGVWQSVWGPRSSENWKPPEAHTCFRVCRSTFLNLTPWRCGTPRSVQKGQRHAQWKLMPHWRSLKVASFTTFAFCGKIIDACVHNIFAPRIGSQWLSAASYMHHIGLHVTFWCRPAFAAKRTKIEFLFEVAILLPTSVTSCSKNRQIQNSGKKHNQNVWSISVFSWSFLCQNTRQYPTKVRIVMITKEANWPVCTEKVNEINCLESTIRDLPGWSWTRQFSLWLDRASYNWKL